MSRRRLNLPPEDERALETLAEDYRALTAFRESRARKRAGQLLRRPVRLILPAGCLALAACALLAVLALQPRPAATGKAALRIPLSSASADSESTRTLPGTEEDPLLREERIPINTAGAEELTRLPGIGPALAERIVREREQNGLFHLPEDLMAVKGIGPGTLEKLLPLITFGEEEDHP